MMRQDITSACHFNFVFAFYFLVVKILFLWMLGEHTGYIPIYSVLCFADFWSFPLQEPTASLEIAGPISEKNPSAVWLKPGPFAACCLVTWHWLIRLCPTDAL